MNPVAKALLVAGSVLILLGLLWQLGLYRLPWGQLPGDLKVERSNFRFYLPLMTSLVVSVLLTLLLKIFR